VPEDCYYVFPGEDCFKLVFDDARRLDFQPVNTEGGLGLIFIFPDYYRHPVFDIDKMFDTPKIDLEDEELRSSDETISLTRLLLVDDNLDAPEDHRRIIIMTAREQQLPYSSTELPTGIDIV